MTLDESFRIGSFGGLFFITALVVIVAIEIGLRFGRWSRQRKKTETDSPIGTMVGAMLGLLAFIMAFTFGSASSNFEARRMAVLKESNAIGTAYLRADFIPEPERNSIKSLLKEYANVRVEAVKTHDGAVIKAGLERSEQILDSLWSQISELEDKNAGTPLRALFVSALNDVIDIHSERVMLATATRIPGIIWLTLLFVTFFSMLAVGYQFGIDETRSILGTIVIALTFSAVMLLIADLDSPSRGLIQTNQWSMAELQKILNEKHAGRLAVDGPSATKGALK